MRELRAQIHKQDLSFKEAEEDLQRSERSCGEVWSQHEERGAQELLLRCFLERCGDVRRSLTDNTQPIREQRRALENNLSKGEVELCFDLSGRGGLNVEPLVMHQMRKLCEDRVQFLKSALAEDSSGGELDDGIGFKDKPTAAQREAQYKDWMNAVQVFLLSHPPSHVLSALHFLTQEQQQRAQLQQQRTTPDEGAHPPTHSVVRNSEDTRPSLKALFQAAWVEVEEVVVELTRTRCRTKELKDDLRVLLNEQSLLHDDQDPLKHGALVQGLARVARAAERRSVQEQCALMEAQVSQTDRDKKALWDTQHSVMALRKAVEKRQETVRDLITAISLSQRQLVNLHAEVRQFLGGSLFPLYGEIIELAGLLSNYVSVETRQFVNVPMAALNCRDLNGNQTPASELSINRINTPRFLKLCKSLDFPMYKVPSELLVHVGRQRLQLRGRRDALLLLSSSTASLHKARAQLPAPHCKALLEKVRLMDEELQRSVLPRATAVVKSCSKGMDACSQLKTVIQHWWEQPAQFALPEMCVEGKTYMQWLYRWHQAVKKQDV
ncbi:HAUS augmin-like complex subunit 5 [Engraulis encrasicolus]|uniref:HAUS augmin-like complex subunit 5 n=1 Tax=Engraulis encrasicolus TaxID=184585 RepID=UPI002FCEE881